MASLLEEFNRMKELVEKAQAKGDQAALTQKVHAVFVDQERKRRAAPSKQTRMFIDFQDNGAYRAAFKEWDRIVLQVVNVTIARHIVAKAVLDALRGLTPERIDFILKEGEEEEAKEDGLPDWAKL